MKGPDKGFLGETTRGKIHTFDSALESPKSSRGEKVGVRFPWKFAPIFLRLVCFSATAAILMKGKKNEIEEFVNSPPLLEYRFSSSDKAAMFISAECWKRPPVVSYGH